jgi:endo-1,3-1,4-beta-glycanase ExoK
MKSLVFANVLFGALLLGAPFAATTLNGGELFSRETVKYGRWEIRMQIAATPGSVSSFFTYYNDSYKGSPEPWREIDIEALGKNGSGFQSNLITGTSQSKVTSEKFHNSSQDLSKSFHTYVLDWTPDSIVYRMDGVLLRKDLGSNQQVKDLADRAQSYRMNLWASTEPAWVGTLDPAKLPVIQTVNWMVYSAYTPGKGPNGSDFTQSWVDDFTTFNTQRWSRGDWTFEGNMADFTVNNIRTADGYLMIILSNKGASVDLTPPKDPVGNTYTPSVSIHAPPKALVLRHRTLRGSHILAGKGLSGSPWFSAAGRRILEIGH